MPVHEEASIEFDLPAQDALGRLSVDGKLRFADGTLFVHWKLADRTFTRTQNKLQTAELGLGDIEKLELKKGWFRTELYLQINDPRLLEEMPGVDIGKLAIKLPKSKRKAAQKLVSVVDFELSQYRAEQSRRRFNELDDEV